jgi:hypothetical protein
VADPKPRGRVGSFLFRGLDRLVPGNNYNRSTGQWSATPVQYIGAVGGLVGNAILPGAGGVIRSAVHGATTGEGRLGFLKRQPQTFTGRPVQALGFTSPAAQLGAALNQRGPNVTPLTPEQLPFTLPTASGPLGFNHGNVVAQPNRQAPSPTSMAGLTGISSQMGGARGAHNQGGVTGEAARAMMEAMQRGPMYVDTGPPVRQ